MKRTVRVARTAHDLVHVNRIVVPEFGVRKLTLATASAASKCHVMDGAPAPPQNTGTDDFNFAPGPQLNPATWAVDAARKDPVRIVYHLFNPYGAIEKARLELFRRFKDTPFWTRELVGDELLDGEHKLKFAGKEEWDGRISKHADFPDDLLTAEHSPYKLKLTVEGKGLSDSPAAWTFFHVLVAKLELDYGPERVLPAPVAGKGNHRAVRQSLVAQGAKPPAAGGGPVKVFLESNLFKKGHSMFDNSLFDQYSNLWEQGPKIPLFATVWVKDSAGQPVLAPKALGKLRFMWDWESKSAATSNTFVDRAQDYDRNLTKPKGQNCHKDRGGKRGPSAPAVFPAANGYDPKNTLDDGVFPFKVEPCPAPREWSAFSYAWRADSLACKTGVLFQPSRMAGDAYSVAVYVAYDVEESGKVKLNVADDAPLPIQPALKATTGTFQVWRKVHLRRYFKKTAAVTGLNVGTVTGRFTGAFVDLEDVSGGGTAVAQGIWDAAFATAIAGWNDREKLMPLANQHAQGPAGGYFRTREAFRAEWAKAEITRRLTNLGVSAAAIPAIAQAAASGATPQASAQNAALAAGYNAANAATIGNTAKAGRDHVDNWLANPANGLDTNEKYANFLQTRVRAILISIFDAQLHPSDGVNIFQVEGPHNLSHHLASFVTGLAHDFASGSDRRCGFLQIGAANLYNPPNHVMEGTTAHEFGHHFFLPHTPDAGEKQNYSAHDTAVANCMMSYNYAVQREFCGFCRLRMRGWSKAALNVNSASNKRP